MPTSSPRRSFLPHKVCAEKHTDNYRMRTDARCRTAVRYNSNMFFVVLRRHGSQWDSSQPLEQQSGWVAHASFMDGLVDSGFIVLGGPLGDEVRVVLAVEAASEDEVRETLARDPWSGTHLLVDSVDPWTIRLDGRAR